MSMQTTTSLSPMAMAIIDYVTRTGGGVSFVELERHIPGFMAEGDASRLEISLEKYNLLLWADLTEAAVDGIRQALAANAIHGKPTSQLVYVIDGKVLSLPIARDFKKYKRERWLPLAFDLGPAPLRARPSSSANQLNSTIRHTPSRPETGEKP
jgi:hypothetical protein